MTAVYYITHGWLLSIPVKPRRITGPINRRTGGAVSNGYVDNNMRVIFMEHFSCYRTLHISRENVIIMTWQWAPWRLKSPASRLFTQPFVQAQIKENIKAPRHWRLCWRIHRWPVNSPHKWPVTRKVFPFDDVIIFHPKTHHRRPIARPG